MATNDFQVKITKPAKKKPVTTVRKKVKGIRITNDAIDPTVGDLAPDSDFVNFDDYGQVTGFAEPVHPFEQEIAQGNKKRAARARARKKQPKDVNLSKIFKEVIPIKPASRITDRHSKMSGRGKGGKGLGARASKRDRSEAAQERNRLRFEKTFDDLFDDGPDLSGIGGLFAEKQFDWKKLGTKKGKKCQTVKPHFRPKKPHPKSRPVKGFKRPRGCT